MDFHSRKKPMDGIKDGKSAAKHKGQESEEAVLKGG